MSTYDGMRGGFNKLINSLVAGNATYHGAYDEQFKNLVDISRLAAGTPAEQERAIILQDQLNPSTNLVKALAKFVPRDNAEALHIPPRGGASRSPDLSKVLQALLEMPLRNANATAARYIAALKAPMKLGINIGDGSLDKVSMPPAPAPSGFRATVPILSPPTMRVAGKIDALTGGSFGRTGQGWQTLLG